MYSYTLIVMMIIAGSSGGDLIWFDCLSQHIEQQAPTVQCASSSSCLSLAVIKVLLNTQLLSC